MNMVPARPTSGTFRLARHESLKTDVRYNDDGMPYEVVRLYNSGSALTANRPYLVTFAGSSVTVQNPRITALAAVGGPFQVVIATEPVAASSWGWFCYRGYYDCGLEGTTDIAAGDFVKVDAAVSTTGLIKDGTSRTIQSVGIATEAQAANSVVNKTIYLFGEMANSALAGSFSTATFSDDLTLSDGADLILGSTTGTKIGTATTQKLGFYNATPVVRQTAYTQTYATADKTHANPTATTLTAASGTADGTVDDVGGAFNQTTLNNNFKEMATGINALIVDVADIKQLANSIIDDLQAYGLFA